VSDQSGQSHYIKKTGIIQKFLAAAAIAGGLLSAEEVFVNAFTKNASIVQKVFRYIFATPKNSERFHVIIVTSSPWITTGPVNRFYFFNESHIDILIDGAMINRIFLTAHNSDDIEVVLNAGWHTFRFSANISAPDGFLVKSSCAGTFEIHGATTLYPQVQIEPAHNPSADLKRPLLDECRLFSNHDRHLPDN
jgi:hypothetical protein